MTPNPVVVPVLKRAYRLAHHLYGSDYKPMYMVCTSGEETIEALEALVADLEANPRKVGFDIESMYCKEFGQRALDVWHPDFQVWCMAFSIDDYQAIGIPFDPDPYLVDKYKLGSIHSHPRIKELVRHILATYQIVTHSTFDALGVGIEKYDLQIQNLDDSQLLSFSLDDQAGDTSVEDLAKLYTEEGDYKKKEYAGHVPATMAEVDWNALVEYNCHDADIERRIFIIQEDLVRKDGSWEGYEKVLKPSLWTGVRNSLAGCQMDLDQVTANIKAERDIQDPLLEEFHSLPQVPACIEYLKKRLEEEPKHKHAKKWQEAISGGFKISKSWMVATLLYDIFKFPCSSKTGTGERSTDEEELEKIRKAHPGTEGRVIDLILGVKKVDKKLSTYLLPYIQPKIANIEDLAQEEIETRSRTGAVERYPYIKIDSRVHPRFNFHKVRSGRSSSEAPNFQNVINEVAIHRMFVSRMWGSRMGKLLAADYAAHEVRFAAWLCKDPAMIRALEIGIHTLNLALLEKFISPNQILTATKELHDQVEQQIYIKYLKELAATYTIPLDNGVYDYHWKEIMDFLSQETMQDGSHPYKELVLQWKNKFKTRRTTAKESTFGPLYGMQPPTFATLQSISLKEAEFIYESDRATYPAKHRYFEAVRNQARKDGFVKSVLGKKRRLDYAGAKGNPKALAELDRQGGNCVDAETEILTQDGWKRYYEVHEGTIILTKNPQTGKMEWHPIKSMWVYPDYEGDLISIESKSFSALTTPHHRWLVDSKRRKNRMEVQFKTSETLSQYGDDRIHRCGILSTPDNPEYTDDFLTLCGWILTDGSIRTNTSGKTYAGVIYQSKPRNIPEIDALLDRMGILTSRSPRESGVVWRLAMDISGRIKELFPERVLTAQFIHSLSTRQARIVMDTMVKGDGSISKEGQVTFCVTRHNEHKADMFQMLVFAAGFSSNKTYFDISHRPPGRSKKIPYPVPATGWWGICIHKRDRAQVLPGQRVRLHNQKQLVWCPEVQNQTWIARRKGQTYVTGNTIVQGPASDLVVLCLGELWRIFLDLGIPAVGIGTIHDSMMIDCAEEYVEELCPLVLETMETYPTQILGGADHVTFKGELEFGPTWGDMESWTP